MKKKILICGFLLLNTAVFAQSAALITKKPQPKAVVVTNTHKIPNYKNYILPRFNGILVNGPINFHIIVDGKANYLEMQGSPALLNAVKYHVDPEGVLQFSIQKKYINPELQINIHAARLNRIIQTGSGNVFINYLIPQALQIDKSGTGNLLIKGKVELVQMNNSGFGNITIKNIKSPRLFMNVSTAGVIKLTGVVNLATLDFSGPGNLQMYWVKSGHLIVHTYGSGTVALAGIARLVDAYANDSSHLDLRYLRARTIFVKSYGNASVDVWANDNLFALARDNSNIYYFNKPGYRSRIMRENSSILPMHNIPGAILTFDTRGSIK